MSTKLVTRNTDYAVRALCYMAARGKREEGVTSVTELVKEMGMPRPFLRKILQKLNTAKLLISQKGKGGGFKLAKPAEKIFITEVMQIFQGPFKINDCMFKRKICPNRKGCFLRRKLEAIEEYAVAQLKGVTIKEILNG
ncbi:MAG TPA: Rrf2 family transcriptional regulator [Candidatus Omnitrophota bacterium]|nr:Rrf2 family transcriptional regulator [Candidatus Omnitrophota bacterium]HPN66124.1 Rrf2 family transcriptional regulator [Candidatus Omnitrophota bacterium]